MKKLAFFALGFLVATSAFAQKNVVPTSLETEMTQRMALKQKRDEAEAPSLQRAREIDDYYKRQVIEAKFAESLKTPTKNLISSLFAENSPTGHIVSSQWQPRTYVPDFDPYNGENSVPIAIQDGIVKTKNDYVCKVRLSAYLDRNPFRPAEEKEVVTLSILAHECLNPEGRELKSQTNAMLTNFTYYDMTQLYRYRPYVAPKPQPLK